MTSTNDALLYWDVDRRLVVRASGRKGKAGIVQFILDGKIAASATLPPVQFTLLALLVEAAMRTEDPVESYVSTDQLTHGLGQYQLLAGGEPAYATKAVSRLREKLEKLPLKNVFNSDDASDDVSEEAGWFGKRFIESQRYFGYRVSIHPQQLQLTLIDG